MFLAASKNGLILNELLGVPSLPPAAEGEEDVATAAGKCRRKSSNLPRTDGENLSIEEKAKERTRRGRKGTKTNIKG